jgi:hypothetical protein
MNQIQMESDPDELIQGAYEQAAYTPFCHHLKSAQDGPPSRVS